MSYICAYCHASWLAFEFLRCQECAGNDDYWKLYAYIVNKKRYKDTKSDYIVTWFIRMETNSADKEREG